MCTVFTDSPVEMPQSPINATNVTVTVDPNTTGNGFMVDSNPTGDGLSDSEIASSGLAMQTIVWVAVTGVLITVGNVVIITTVVVCVMVFKSRRGKRDNDLPHSEKHNYDDVEIRCGPIYMTPVKNALMNEADAETPPPEYANCAMAEDGRRVPVVGSVSTEIPMTCNVAYSVVCS